MNNAAVNICVQVFVWTCVFISLGYIPRSRIARPYVKSMFNILRNCQTVSQSSYTILHSQQLRIGVPVSPTIISWYCSFALAVTHTLDALPPAPLPPTQHAGPTSHATPCKVFLNCPLDEISPSLESCKYSEPYLLLQLTPFRLVVPQGQRPISL